MWSPCVARGNERRVSAADPRRRCPRQSTTARHLPSRGLAWAGAGGRLWDQSVTDEDGPYAELMVGGLSDNQPDYSWIKPHEVKTFTHHWYPVQEIGGFTKANLEAAVNLEVSSGRSEEHTSELQSLVNLVCRLLLEKKKIQ